MRYQKYLNRLRLTVLNFKSIRLSYFVPLVALFVYLPVISVLYNNFYGFEYIQDYIVAELQMTIPYFSVWWILFGLREYIEGSGSEVLKTYRKSLGFEFVHTFIWYILHTIVIVSAFCVAFVSNYFVEFICVILPQTLLFASAAFFLMTLTKTIAVPFLACTIYEIFFMFAGFDLIPINILCRSRVYDYSMVLIPYIPLFAASIAVAVLGNVIYKKRAVG